MQQTKADVLAKLRAAFPAEPIRFEGALTGGLDAGVYRGHVDGKTWEELDRAHVLDRSDVLGFLEPRHLIAVLPVYLRSLVEEGTRTSVPDTLLLVLDKRSEPRFDQIFDALTPAQRATIATVLDTFAAAESGQPADAARAASVHWKEERLNRKEGS